MKRISNLLLIGSVLGLLIGLSNVANEAMTGFALAIGAVTFILAFITRIVERAEAF